MNKTLILPFFALIALVSLAWGAYTVCTGDYAGSCKWSINGTACDEISIQPGESWSKDTCKEAYDNCVENGYLYTDDACVTWSGKGNNPNFNGGVSIWCQWTTGCQPIKDSDELDNCKINGSVYENVDDDDVGNDKECKNSGEWTGEGKDPNANILGCCNWDGLGKCYQVFETSDWNDCSAEYRYATCPGDEAGTCIGNPLPIPSSSSTAKSSSSGANASSSSNGEDTDDLEPIISYNNVPVIGLNVVHFARNLRIASDKNATISLFNIKGKLVLSQKVQSGTTTISLANQKVGVYYAVAKSGSQKQIVKIVLK